jgi:hypothetical protein
MKSLLSPQVQDFIDRHLGSDYHAFLFDFAQTAIFGEYVRGVVNSLDQGLAELSRRQLQGPDSPQLLHPREDKEKADEETTTFKTRSTIGMSTFYA